METFETLAGEDLGKDLDRYLGYRELNVRADGRAYLDDHEIDPATVDVLRRGQHYGRSEKIDAAYENGKLKAAAQYGRIRDVLPDGTKVIFYGWEITKDSHEYFNPSYW